MAGPYPPPDSSPQGPSGPPDPRYGPPGYFPGPVPSPYPGALPPPIPYPQRSKRRFLVAGLAIAILVAVAAFATLVVFVTRGEEPTDTALTPERAKTAIQAYMDALSQGDDETVARNASCGLYDEIEDRKADMALAKLASDAFQRQFKSAEVTSIDKIVTWSPNQAQVLFTLRVKAARAQGEAQRQAVAQVLTQGDQVLVCSYLPRTGLY